MIVYETRLYGERRHHVRRELGEHPTS